MLFVRINRDPLVLALGWIPAFGRVGPENTIRTCPTLFPTIHPYIRMFAFLPRIAVRMA